MGKWFSIGASAAIAVTLAACGSSSAVDKSSNPAGSSTTSAQTGTLTVYAAASLKKTFTELGKQFESAHPGVKVTFNFAGSSDLVTQLTEGAPADVFASADQKNMDKASASKLVAGTPTVFATNTLEIAVPKGNPGKVNSLQDLTRSDVKVVLCAPAVPCGSAAAKVEKAAGITIKPVSEESSVTDVLNKVQTGQADAGLVYETDILGAAGKVDGVNFTQASAVVNRYPIAVLSDSKNTTLAQQFVALVTSAAGQHVLTAAGFGKP